MTERLSTYTEVFALLLERIITSKETHFWKDTKFTVFPVEGGGEGCREEAAEQTQCSVLHLSESWLRLWEDGTVITHPFFTSGENGER